MAKRRGAASKIADVVAGPEEKAVTKTEVVTEPIVVPVPVAAPTPPQFIIDVCGSCGVQKRITYYDADLNWELPGHPDHFSRPICYECIGSEFARNRLCVAVYEAMRKKLPAQGLDPHEIETAVHTAWRTFNVNYDHDALLKLAKQLKVKTSWAPIKH